MARTPGELEAQARQRGSRRPHPDTLDGNSTASGAAVSRPALPLYDSDVSMVANARSGDNDTSAVPEDVAQATGKVRPKSTGTRFVRTR